MSRVTFRIIVALVTFVVGLITTSVWISRHQPRVQERVSIGVAPKAETFYVAPKPDSQQRGSITVHVQNSKYLKEIEVISHDENFPIYESQVADLSMKAINLDLELGNSLENQIIILHSYPNESNEFKIEQQFETSMTIMEEGPHLDLTDWKHYTSEWKEIKMIENHRFLTLKISETNYQRFPKVTRKQIREAAIATMASSSDFDSHDKKLWSERARQCKSATDDPCAVSVSKISFRIKVRDKGNWKIINNLVFNIPMGC